MKNKLIDLYREYVRCADMCSEYNAEHKTNIQPRECVQLKSATGEWVGYFSLDEPNFAELLNHKVRFALAIVSGTPVFTGYIIFRKTTGYRVMVHAIDSNILDFTQFALEPPPKQRTFMLNGVKLPMPRKEFSRNKVHLHMVDYRPPKVYEEIFAFETLDEAVEFYDGLRNILRDARDKE